MKHLRHGLVPLLAVMAKGHVDTAARCPIAIGTS